MTITLTWNGTSLPAPAMNGITLGDDLKPSDERMITGTLRQQVVALKKKITIRWHGLLEAERTTLYNTYTSRYNTSSSLVVPGYSTYTVLCTDGWNESSPYLSKAGIYYYAVTLVFKEI